MRHTKSSATEELGTRSLVSDLVQRIEHVQIKKRLAQARTEAGLKQPEVGELLEPPVHWRTIQEWESKKNDNVPFRRMPELAAIYNVSFIWLLHGDAKQPAEEYDHLLEQGQENAQRLGSLEETVGRIEALLSELLRSQDSGR